VALVDIPQMPPHVVDLPAGLELRHLTKQFGAVVADADVSVCFERGEVHALVGENGAGKSTLMNVCFGIEQPTSGEIVIDGQVTSISSPLKARQHGIGMVHQHFKLVPSLTVAENVFLGAELLSRRGSLDRRRMEREVTAVSNAYGLAVDPTRRVSSLSAGLRQRVEILKALYFDAQVLILDEPTAVLTPQETEALFRVLGDVATSGRTVILITHKLGEVKAVADRYTVMRQGRVVATGSTAEISERELAALMVGRDVDLERRGQPAAEPRPGKPRLRCRGLRVRADDGEIAVQDVSLDLPAGVITGIAGIEGNGQTEFVEALAGLRAVVSGTVRFGGRDITRWTVRDRRRAGLAHVPEDRLRSGIALPSSIRDNLAAAFLRSQLFMRGLLRGRMATVWTAGLIERYDIRGARPETPASQLSGGNMQKVVLARELESRPEVLLAAHPTRGVDVGAIEFIYERLRDESRRGVAILLISADLGELLAVADRIVVMHRGQLVAEFAPEADNIPSIGLAMAGVPEERDRYIAPRLVEEGPPAPVARPTSTTVSVTPGHRRMPTIKRQAALKPLGSLAANASQPVSAVAIALTIGLIAIVAIGAAPIESYHNLLLGSFSNTPEFNGLVTQATPLLLIAASVYASFRAGIINIGAEGQMYVGAFLGAYVPIALHAEPVPLLIALGFVSGALAGAIWSAVPGLLYAHLGVDVLVSTLMLNYVATSLTAYFVDGPLRDPSGGIPETKPLPSGVQLPHILGFGGANVGIFIALGAVLFAGLIYTRTSWGLQARLIGENRDFAQFVGVDVKRRLVEIMAFSGLLAGVAGVVESLGTQLRFNQSFSPGFGFLGLTVALLGRLNPFGLILAAALYAALEQGSSLMQLNNGVPLSLVNVLEGIMIMLVTASALRLGGRRQSRISVDVAAAGELSAVPGGLR
jgi:ABC-type uncharacterized transport system ATPase subunit/ABC-type uncharacterized transport system permease subunit